MAHFTTSDGLSLYFTDEGAGLPILCLAGLTRTTADFDYVTPHLNGVRLIKILNVVMRGSCWIILASTRPPCLAPRAGG